MILNGDGINKKIIHLELKIRNAKYNKGILSNRKTDKSGKGKEGTILTI